MRFLKSILFFVTIICSVPSTGQHSLVKLPDSLNKSTKYYSPDFRPIGKPAFWGILTIGQPLDSLDLEPYYKNQPPYVLEDSIREFYGGISGLSIVVDTAREADCTEYIYYSDERKKYYPANRFSYFEKGQLISRKALAFEQIEFKGIPVYIANFSSEEITIKHPKYRLHLVQEALDRNNEWRQIETIFKTPKASSSSTGIHTLKPGQFILTTVYKYKGDFQTQLRLRFISGDKVYYSKPFSGSVNYSQILAKGN